MPAAQDFLQILAHERPQIVNGLSLGGETKAQRRPPLDFSPEPTSRIFLFSNILRCFRVAPVLRRAVWPTSS